MRILILSALLSATVLLAGCQRPPAPDPERPPEPQALARAAKQPIDRARAVQKTVDDGAERQRSAEADAAH
ncbi:TPA: hypothetical protein UMV35_000097 [Stenotrophomonas maltophilia]|uniref:hypothetical protein n=1 Tax=Stenotrophomonas TaxID=40323 RepID=UPI0013DAAF99|nr:MULTISPECIES: hypothetical protein [Stenotrophomonas]MBH1593727.1 hypothetical protein [Stenotrophomonas maltophilia]MDH2021201.1 hypothetical protein [Stenotrophomonas sp. GD03680]HEL3747864.1 hypothetical protein [Stenotrophomonas maltophilia]HEL7728818.1 hypothetical protein [Stenotrophomonas maltophilia]